MCSSPRRLECATTSGWRIDPECAARPAHRTLYVAPCGCQLHHLRAPHFFPFFGAGGGAIRRPSHSVPPAALLCWRGSSSALAPTLSTPAAAAFVAAWSLDMVTSAGGCVKRACRLTELGHDAKCRHGAGGGIAIGADGRSLRSPAPQHCLSHHACSQLLIGPLACHLAGNCHSSCPRCGHASVESRTAGSHGRRAPL